MRLRKECEHGRWDPHRLEGLVDWSEDVVDWPFCPGGEFLLEGALVVERDADGEWKLPHRALLVLAAGNAFSHPEGPIALLNDFADALASQVGESE